MVGGKGSWKKKKKKLFVLTHFRKLGGIDDPAGDWCALRSAFFWLKPRRELSAGNSAGGGGGFEKSRLVVMRAQK